MTNILRSSYKLLYCCCISSIFWGESYVWVGVFFCLTLFLIIEFSSTHLSTNIKELQVVRERELLNYWYYYLIHYWYSIGTTLGTTFDTNTIVVTKTQKTLLATTQSLSDLINSRYHDFISLPSTLVVLLVPQSWQ